MVVLAVSMSLRNPRKGERSAGLVGAWYCTCSDIELQFEHVRCFRRSTKLFLDGTAESCRAVNVPLSSMLWYVHRRGAAGAAMTGCMVREGKANSGF